MSSAATASWQAIGDLLADAQTAARIMANPALPTGARDAAAARHAIVAAALIDELAALRREGVLDAIAGFLEDRYG